MRLCLNVTFFRVRFQKCAVSANPWIRVSGPSVCQLWGRESVATLSLAHTHPEPQTSEISVGSLIKTHLIRQSLFLVLYLVYHVIFHLAFKLLSGHLESLERRLINELYYYLLLMFSGALGSLPHTESVTGLCVPRTRTRRRCWRQTLKLATSSGNASFPGPCSTSRERPSRMTTMT